MQRPIPPVGTTTLLRSARTAVVVLGVALIVLAPLAAHRVSAQRLEARRAAAVGDVRQRAVWSLDGVPVAGLRHHPRADLARRR